MEWLREKKCYKGVVESSGIYWVPIYTVRTDNGFESWNELDGLDAF